MAQGITHKGAFLVVVGLFWIVVTYAFIISNQVSIKHSKWESYLGDIGGDVTHDDDMWFYKGVSTCVQYNGNFEEECDKSVGVCAGGTTYGNYIQQTNAVKRAARNSGVHPRCPLVYYGTD